MQIPPSKLLLKELTTSRRSYLSSSPPGTLSIRALNRTFHSSCDTGHPSEFRRRKAHPPSLVPRLLAVSSLLGTIIPSFGMTATSSSPLSRYGPERTPSRKHHILMTIPTQRSSVPPKSDAQMPTGAKPMRRPALRVLQSSSFAALSPGVVHHRFLSD